MCILHKLSHCLCHLLPCKALSDVFRWKGSINKFDLAFFCSTPSRVFHYASWWIHARAGFDSPPIHLCILVGNNARLTFMSDMLGRIIRLYKRRWNEGDQTSVTPVLETEQISRPLLWTPSSARPLKHGPASTLISPETTSICRMGTARYMQDPASCWHCLRLCCLPLLLPILTVSPIRRAGEGERQTWRDVGFAVRGGLV